MTCNEPHSIANKASMTDNNLKSQRLLALDVGTKTCGIALTDELGITIQPLKTIRYQGVQKIKKVLTEILIILLEYKPQIIVVGLPYNMDGSEGSQALKVREFVAALKNHLKKNNIAPNQFQWVFFDERCTSEEAEKFLLEHDVSRKKRKEVLDKMAAVFILQRYLEELSDSL